MAGIGVLYYIFAPWLMAFFGEDPSVNPEFAHMHEMGVHYLRIMVFAYPLGAVGITLAQALNGAGSTRAPLVLDAIGFLAVQIPLAAFICLTWQENGYTRSTLWWSLVATTGIAASFYAVMWDRGHWVHKKIQ